MNPEILNLILIGIAVVVLAGLGVWFAIPRKRSQKLREKFGPEYDYTMKKEGDQRAAEAALREREKRVSALEIRELDSEQWDRYVQEWTEVQAAFVDDPSKAVEQANRLITEVMIARGFPVADFEQRAADLSVLYPNFVPNYRQAYAIAKKNQEKGASTEELRQAMVNYHSLFEELLGLTEVKKEQANDKELITQ
jgi:hypothetical protein